MALESEDKIIGNVIKDDSKHELSSMKPTELFFNQSSSEIGKILPKKTKNSKFKKNSRNYDDKKNVAKPIKSNSNLIDDLVKNYPGYVP